MESYIRNATTEDAEDLALIYSKSFHSAFKGIISDEFLDEKFSYERLKGRLSEEVSKGTPINSIMVIDDIAVGMVTYTDSKNEENDSLEAEIWRIYLLPEYWNQNIGMELMEWSLKDLEAKGYKKVSLWVIEENVRARRFYEKFGFEHDGKIRVINVGREIKDYRYIKYL